MNVTRSGVCLYLVPGGGLPWEDAEGICDQYDGHLVAITDSEKQEDVQRMMEDTGVTDVWIGLAETNDKLWRWSDGEWKVEESGWKGVRGWQ